MLGGCDVRERLELEALLCHQHYDLGKVTDVFLSFHVCFCKMSPIYGSNSVTVLRERCEIKGMNHATTSMIPHGL